uniref:Protein kinase domain-containing protein n=1 Tax=Ganoderma boninense TaxID=34458 RepID=A0A5K1K804_9APHY|nr:Protein kinase domain-containing protein [Ganoderma boninense]
MLSNPDFIPPPLRLDGEVSSHSSTAYDDLPPLEDDMEPSSASNVPIHDLLNQIGDGAPRLEADHSSPVVASPQPTLMPLNAASTLSSSDPSTAASRGTPSSAQQTVSHGLLVSTTSGRATSRPPRIYVDAEDDGAESDSSLPSLQSVSDSSSDEGDYISESGSEWDDDESLDESEGEPDIARLVEEAETQALATETLHNLTVPNPPAAAGVLPNFGAPPNMFRNTLQSYRELLDRARVLIPDIDARLGPPPDLVADITNRLFTAGADNDFERAETLIQAMEVVSDELVLRYEKLRSTDGEDVDGCAICRDDLVDKSPDTLEASRVFEIFALLPFPSEADSSVAFPCAGKHLFHKHCLLPWLARKTTCPSCRFDIDPHSLTLRISRGLRDVIPITPDTDRAHHPPRVWQAPQVESMRDWLTAEERAKETGIPRVRPEVVMPEYQTPFLPQPDPTPSALLGVPAWGTDPETGRFDMTVAYRDIQDMREQLLDIEDRQRASDLPIRPPSAPPVATPEADLFPEIDDFPEPNARFRPPRRDSEYDRLRQQIAIERHGAHMVPFHNFPASLMDHVVNLTSRPVARGPPPNNIGLDVFAGRRLDAPGSLDSYSQILRELQNMRRSANPLHPLAPPPPPPLPATASVTAPPQSNPAQTVISPAPSVNPNTPHPTLVTQDETAVGSHSATNGGGAPSSSGHNHMEELD